VEPRRGRTEAAATEGVVVSGHRQKPWQPLRKLPADALLEIKQAIQAMNEEDGQ